MPQHVTQRGNNRQPCFFEDEDRLYYLRLARFAARRRECRIHAYVLMGNHVHFLLTPMKEDGASTFMQDIGRLYVKFINDKRGRTGTLFEGRFKSSLVDSTSYCLACYRYIELNPVRAQLVALPEQYRWSSYHANALGEPDNLVTPHEEWLGLGKEDALRRWNYRNLFADQVPVHELELIREKTKRCLPVGSDRFTKRIAKRLDIKLRSAKLGRPQVST